MLFCQFWCKFFGFVFLKQIISCTLPKLPLPSILCSTKSSIAYLGWGSFLGTAYRGSSDTASVNGVLTSPGPSHEMPKTATNQGQETPNDEGVNVKKRQNTMRMETFRGYMPLFAGVPVAGKHNPEGARTIPGWLTLTGPSRPMMSASLVLLALKSKVGPASRWYNYMTKNICA